MLSNLWNWFGNSQLPNDFPLAQISRLPSRLWYTDFRARVASQPPLVVMHDLCSDSYSSFNR